MTSAVKTIPSPVRGWVESENLAVNRGVGALVAENGFPLASTVRLRAGDFKAATMNGAAVQSLIPYRSGSQARLFATTAAGIYDISALNPEATPPPSVVLTDGGRWSPVQIATPGGQFLVMVDGQNGGQVFDGTSWAAMSVTGVASSALSHLWIHANRIWGIQKGTMTAWFLPVDSIGGAALDFSLGSVFQRGGSLLFGDTWTSDSGSGFGDRCVFVSTEGEIAVYEGLNPGGSSSWALVGRYDVGRPVGVQTIRAGADLLIATTDGIVPLSQIVTKDPAALSMAAVSANIERPWLRAVRTNASSLPVQMLKWQRESMGIVAFPHLDHCFVVNLQTGAWAKWTGKAITAMALHNDLAYWAGADGFVYQFEGAGADDGAPYAFRWSLLPDDLGAAGRLKHVYSARATWRALVPFVAQLDVATDYRRDFEQPPPNAAPDDDGGALWDVALWDAAIWDDGADSDAQTTVTTLWQSINRSGIVVAPQVQVTCGGSRKPDAELVTVDLLYDVGGVVV